MWPFKRSWKCGCVDVGMGSYDNQVVLTDPFTGKCVGIDRCIADEIKTLWGYGIRTVASCCGHNVAPPTIMVQGAGDHVREMLVFNYEQDESFKRQGRRNVFLAQSVKETSWWRWLCS